MSTTINPVSPTSPASAAMDSLAARMTPVDLATVLQRAELQDRVDTKYVLYPAVLARLVARAGALWWAVCAKTLTPIYTDLPGNAFKYGPSGRYLAIRGRR